MTDLLLTRPAMPLLSISHWPLKLTCGAGALLLALSAAAQSTSAPAMTGSTSLSMAGKPETPERFRGATESRPAALELSWTPVRLPNGDRLALAGANYLVALNDDWGFGPSAYGAAKGNYGGIFTFGFTAQRRWRLGQDTHLAASLYAGAGGGLSSSTLRYGGGLMLRPELSIRQESGNWYIGAGVAQTRFPSGNVNSTQWTLQVGHMGRFDSFSPRDAGRSGRTGVRTGMGFDEITLNGGVVKPTARNRNRSGLPDQRRMGRAGAELRQYISDGAWWGVEAAGAAGGGADGYMEALALAGQDWAVLSPRLRAGGQLAVGLGGGGNVDTGNGWLLRGGPTLRWITPWGPTLRLEANWTRAPRGAFDGRELRIGLAMPLEPGSRVTGEERMESATVQTQSLYASLQHLPRVRYKDGAQQSMQNLVILMTRDLSESVYGTAQAGSAAFGRAGAYSIGLFGLGLQTPRRLGDWRFGAEALVGAAGGGGVDVGGGAVAQWETWAQWEGGRDDRLRLRAGLGQWRSLRGQTQTVPLVQLALGYTWGTLKP